MSEMKITNDKERMLILSALISHASKCRETIKLHSETKEALKENAIALTAEKAKNEMEEALTVAA